jgi:hypothetical protein
MSKRPKTWNDDVRWLLARIAGIQPGTWPDSGDLPVGSPTSWVVERVRGSVAGQDSTSEVAVQLPTYATTWWLVSVRFFRTAGSAATYQYRLGEVAGFVAGSIDERIVVKSRAVGKPLDDALLGSPGVGVPLQADGAGRVYCRPGWAAGADNAADWDLWFVQAIEAR